MRTTLLILALIMFILFTSYAQGAPLDQGIAQYRAENFEESIPLLQEARRLDPASTVAAYYLGLARKQTGDTQAALADFRDAVTHQPIVQDAYPELIACLYDQGAYQEARTWIAQAEQAGALPAQIAFLKGMVLAGAGEGEPAMTAFRTAARLDPSLGQAATLQVAMLQAKDRHLDEARQSLKALISLNPTSELASLAREYDASFARVLASYRSWHASVGLAYLYDDNVVSKPSNDIAGIQISGEEDHGMVAKAHFDYAPLLDGGRQFGVQYDLQSTTYGSNDAFNTIVQSLALLPGKEFSWGAVTVPLSYAHVLLGQDNYLGIGTLRPTLSILTTGSQIAQLSAGYARREMFQAPLAPDEDRDGDLFSVGAGYLIPFANGEGLASLRYEFTQDNTKGSNWANQGHRGSLNLLLPVARHLKTTLSGDIYGQRYLHHNTSFDTDRDDTIFTASAGLTWQPTPSLTLSVIYGFTRAESSIGAYDYRRNTLTSGFEYSF